MLKIRIIVVDRTRSPFLKEGESLYMKRLRRYARVDWIEVKPARVTKRRPETEVLAAEGLSMAKRFQPGDYLVALDRSGFQYDSEELADWLAGLSAEAWGAVCFLIGGPLGLSKEIFKASHRILSLSRLTLTHEMSRVVLLEQLYRAFTIMKGEKYHK